MGVGNGNYNDYKCIYVCNLVVGVMLLWPTLCYSQDFVYSRATYYGSPDGQGNPTGACGYSEFGRTVNNGNVAAVSRLYRGGTGCGGCYQVRCKASGLCTDDGVTVVATDHGEGDHTDFILSPRAYTGMARSGLEPDLLAYGVVDIEFRRVPCAYSSGPSLVIRIHERSNYPQYLAIVFIYLGMSDIIGAQIWQEDTKEWRPMRKPFGAVWDIENPPRASVLSIRLFLASSVNSGNSKWVELPSAVPDGWKVGDLYDTGVQLD